MRRIKKSKTIKSKKPIKPTKPIQTRLTKAFERFAQVQEDIVEAKDNHSEKMATISGNIALAGTIPDFQRRAAAVAKEQQKKNQEIAKHAERMTALETRARDVFDK